MATIEHPVVTISRNSDGDVGVKVNRTVHFNSSEVEQAVRYYEIVACYRRVGLRDDVPGTPIGRH